MLKILAEYKSSAALAALFLMLVAVPLRAAVPVEESVEEPVVRDEPTPGQQVQPLLRAEPIRPERRRTPSLDIPPTIEPSAPGQADPSSAPPSGFDTPAIGQQGAAGGQGLRDLFYQMQILRQEIQDLRGQVEEQGYQLQRLQQLQKDQYVDLDSRVMALSSNQPTPAPTTTAADSPNTAVATGVPVTERDAYRQAFEAMRQQQFDVSMNAFQRLIEDYPNGQFTPNAFYWIGEIFLVANQDMEQARQSFIQVVNLYPDHQKAPDAMYKLGVVYSGLGDNDAARRYLERVQREYPDAPAAGLARKLAAELN